MGVRNVTENEPEMKTKKKSLVNSTSIRMLSLIILLLSALPAIFHIDYGIALFSHVMTTCGLNCQITLRISII